VRLVLVHLNQLQQVLVTLLGSSLVLSEQHGCTLGELTGKSAVAGLVHQELLIAILGSLGVQSKLAGLLGGIEAEQIPVAALNSLLHFSLAVHHTALNGVHLTGSVADDQGRTVVCLCLADSLDGLCLVCAHSDLGNIDIAVAHCNLSKALLLGLFTGGCELSNLTDVGSLGSLTAGVGVDLGIEYKDVHILVGGQHMVNTAEADVVCPAVATEDPNGLLAEVFLLREDLLNGVAADLCFQISDQCLGSSLVGLAIVEGVQPSLAGSLALVGDSGLHNGADLVSQRLTDHSLCGVHTQTVLSVVLEQGVCPCGTVTVSIYSVGRGSSGTAPDGGAAGSVGDIHTVAEQLSYKASVAGLSTACAGAGELKQGLLELAALDGIVFHFGLLSDLGDHIVEDFLLAQLLLLRYHVDSLGGTYADTDAASHAVQRRNSHGVGVNTLALASLDGNDACSSGSGSSLSLSQSEGTDGCVGADISTVVTLDTLGLVPVRNGDGNATLLVSSSAQGELTVSQTVEGGNRQAVAVHLANGVEDGLNDLNGVSGAFQIQLVSGGLSGSPSGGNIDLHICGSAGVDGIPVLVNNIAALLQVGSLSSGLHIADGLAFGHNLCKAEESGLQNGVGALAHTNLDSQVDSIDGVELDVILSDVALGSGI